ncbi:MAG: hypothetical protein J2P41_03510, partial [Blastocatellia bacterium]|nr:hypothetical protein [Blastocatellia bacterium]
EEQTVLLALAPGSRDLAEPEKAIISAETKYLKLQVSLEKQEKSLSYRVALKTADNENREIWKSEGLGLQKDRTDNFIVIYVPADLFREVKVQDYMYVLTVEALGRRRKSYEETGSYYFQVAVK